jgi:protease I
VNSGSQSEAKNVLVILGEGFEDTETAVLVSVLRWTEYRPYLTQVNVTISGLRPFVRGRFGATYEVDIPIEEVDPNAYDAVVVPGGFRSRGFEELYDERVLSIISAMNEQGKPIVTLCVGVFVPGEAGVLADRKATVYELSANRDNPACLEGYGATPTYERFCIDGNIVSCTGPAVSEETAAWLLEVLIGEEQAAEVARFRLGLKQQ